MEIKCKEPGCPEVIEYEPAVVYSFRARTDSRARKKVKRVFLTCKNEHTHPYVIET